MEICGDNEQETLINGLPDEILAKIFSYLSLKELSCFVRVVCKRWFYVSCTEMLWSKLTAEDIKELEEAAPFALLQFVSVNTSSLKYLLLDNCYDIPIHAIAKLVPNLRELSLAFCSQVNKFALQTFSENCPEITALNLEGCEEITHDCLTLFAGHFISRLNLSHCNHLTDDSLIFVTNVFRNIKDLNLDGVQWISDDAVRLLLENCKGTLRYLWLDGENLTDLALTMLGGCNNLLTLKISYCEQLTDLTLSTITQMEKLRSLSLKKGKNFSREEIVQMFRNLKTGLLYLDFTDCRAFNDQAVLCLTQSSPDLITLDLSWCWEVTDEGLAHIVCGCRRMRKLTLIGMHSLTGEPLKETVNRLPQLKYLDLRNCNSIKDNIIRDVVKQCVSLTVWDYYGQLLE